MSPHIFKVRRISSLKWMLSLNFMMNFTAFPSNTIQNDCKLVLYGSGFGDGFADE